MWAGQTVSELGSRITRDGLPLLAVILLGATPAQMGLLNAAASLPVLVFGLAAGVWVDRLRRRPLLIASDVLRAALLALIPLAALLGGLRMELLYLVAALAGLLGLLFDTAYAAYLPALVGRRHLVEGNSRLAASSALAEVLGPGITGFLVQALSAPIAIFFDALSFLVSALSLAWIRSPEPPPPPAEQTRPWLEEARAGLSVLWQDARLRALLLAVATLDFFGNFIGVLYSLYAIRELGFSPALLGMIIAAGGAGSLLGALLAAPLMRRFGLGRTLAASLALLSLFNLLIPLAAGVSLWAAAALLVAGQLGDCLREVFFINALSLRQAAAPPHALGRVGAAMELAAAGIAPLGALLGGWLGGAIGVRPTLFAAALGGALAAGWVLASPLRRMRTLE